MKIIEKNKKTLFFVAALLCVYYITSYEKEVDLPKDLDEIFAFNVKERLFSKETYQQDCLDLYRYLRNPNPKLLIRPPPKKIPKVLYDEFTQNGQMPVKNILYFNEIYSDSFGSFKLFKRKIKNRQLDELREKVRNNDPLGYEDKTLNELMSKNRHLIENRTMVVIGTQYPWIEAIGYELNASHITTIEYTRKSYENSARLTWLHVNDYLDETIKSENLENYDNAVSFSSIEHSGLGRYGDPLSPNGDLEAVRQVHCMLKPGGLFFLGIPVSKDNSNFIEFNAHRFYGKARLALITKGWEILDFKFDTPQFHGVFILKKVIQ